MSSFIKMATFAITLHVVFYVAMNLVYVPDTTSAAGPNDYLTLGNATGIFRFEPDLFDIFIGTDNEYLAQSIQDNWTIYGTINTTKVSIPDKVGGQSIGTNVISFLDPLSIVYGIKGGLNTLLNVGAGPLAILSSNKIHPIVGILIGMTYIIIVFFAIIAFIRGVSD